VPHVAHDAQRLSAQLHDYIDKNKVTNHTYIAKLEDPLPADLAKEYSVAVGYNKDLVNTVLNMRQEAARELRAAQSTGNLLSKRVTKKVEIPSLP